MPTQRPPRPNVRQPLPCNVLTQTQTLLLDLLEYSESSTPQKPQTNCKIRILGESASRYDTILLIEASDNFASKLFRVRQSSLFPSGNRRQRRHSAVLWLNHPIPTSNSEREPSQSSSLSPQTSFSIAFAYSESKFERHLKPRKIPFGYMVEWKSFTIDRLLPRTESPPQSLLTESVSGRPSST